MYKVTYVPYLFDESVWIRFESHNQTILSIFQFLFQKHPEVRNDSPCITVRVNGKKIHPLLWTKPLKDGDEVLIIQEIGWEATLFVAGLLGTLGISGATAATIGVAVGAVLTYGALAATIFSIAYSIYSYCTAPEAPKTGLGLNSSPTYGWEGAKMQVRQGVPVPIVYGEHLLGGHITGGR